MQTKPARSAKTAELRELVAQPEHRPMMAELYRRAEAALRKRRKQQASKEPVSKSAAGPPRLLHELQVRQLQLEMQNTELRQARDHLEETLENYTDLYDFAPAGYFTLAADGGIHQVNLTGACLVGSERSLLVGRPFGRLVSAEGRPAFHAFLEQVFSDQTKRSEDFELARPGQPPVHVNIEAQRLPNGLECRAVVMDITARKQTEQHLRRTLDFDEAVMTNMGEGLYTVDAQVLVTSLNPAAEKLLGWSLEELRGRRMHDVTHHHHPDGTPFPAADCAGEQVLRQGAKLTRREDCFIRKDGTFFDVVYSASPLQSGGVISGLVVVFRDVSERKQAEKQIRHSEIRYRRLFEATHDGVLLLDPATRKITDANPFMTKLLGYKHDQLVGKELFEIGLLKDEAASQEMFQKLKADQEIRYEDLPLESKTGRHQEVEVVANLYQENGHAVIQCNIRDISERKRAQLQLQENERRFREMVDALPAAIYTTDAKGRITHFNQAAVEFSGRTPKLGTDHWCVTWKLFWPDGTPMPHAECPMAMALKEARAIRGQEAIAERPDGTRIWFTPYPTPLRDGKGRIVGGINMLVDITERKQTETQMADDLEAMTRLQQVGLHCVQPGADYDTCVAELLAAAIAVTGADKGNFQLFDTATGTLTIAAQRGFKKPFLKFFARVNAGQAATCGLAMKTARPVHVEDVTQSEIFAGQTSLKVLLDAGVRAVQSMPLMSSAGKVLGMISTHFAAPHPFDERDLRLMDLLARQAADYLERKQAEAALHASEARFRSLFASSPMAVFACDRNSVIEHYNRRAVELWGREPECGVERHCGSVRLWLPDGTRLPHAQSPIVQVLRTGCAVLNREVLIERPDGSRLPVLVNFAALKNAQGEVTGAITSFVDLTERKKAEAERRRMAVLTASNRKLEQEIVRRQAVEESLEQSKQQQNLLLEQSRHMQGQLRHFSHQILRVQEEERKRISRELHDVIAQTLAGINLQLASLKAEVETNPRGLPDKIAGTQRLVQKSVEIVHQFARELRPGALDDLGLIPALHSYAKNFAKQARLRVRLKVSDDVEQLDGSKRTVLYRVAQEALTNVARHARATQVKIGIEKIGGGVHLCIKDNGKSFAVQRTLDAKKNRRLGLVGMRERVEMEGGSFNVESAPGQGTTIQVQIPLDPVRAGETARKREAAEHRP